MWTNKYMPIKSDWYLAKVKGKRKALRWNNFKKFFVDSSGREVSFDKVDCWLDDEESPSDILVECRIGDLIEIIGQFLKDRNRSKDSKAFLFGRILDFLANNYSDNNKNVAKEILKLSKKHKLTFEQMDCTKGLIKLGLDGE